MIWSRTLQTLTLAALCAGCSLFSTRPQLRELHLQLQGASTPGTAPHDLHLAVTARGPDGGEHRATGAAQAGESLAALCASLRRALAADGCEATCRDEPDAAHMVLQLPDDWELLSARATSPAGASGGRLVFTLGPPR